MERAEAPRNMASNDEASLGLTCPRCLASLQVSSLLAGKQCRCPHCQLVARRAETDGDGGRSEEPPLGQDERPPPAGQATYIPVVCPICHTRMYGTIEQVGQKLSCPDCGTASVVPPPPAVAKATAVPAAVDVYRVGQRRWSRRPALPGRRSRATWR